MNPLNQAIDRSAPGEDRARQPGKGPVTVFVAGATIVACLGFVGHLAGLL